MANKKKVVDANNSSKTNNFTESEKEKLLQMSEISLLLDSYGSIFSDFDPRAFSQRALSDDFLIEAKKAARDKVSGQIELKFLIPAAKRNSAHEALIKKRLSDHFRKHYLQLSNEHNSIIKQGILFTISGIIVMIITTFVLFKFGEKGFLISFLIILLEPAGWFLFWEGLYVSIFDSRKVNPELEFYEKMHKCEMKFLAY